MKYDTDEYYEEYVIQGHKLNKDRRTLFPAIHTLCSCNELMPGKKLGPFY